MNKLTPIEANFLNAMNEHLKPETNRQAVINLLRNVTTTIYNQGKKDGRTGWQGDVTWTDDQLK